MFYECGGGQDLSPIVAAINLRLPVADRIDESASSQEIVAALNKITKPIIDLVNTKATNKLADSASTQQIIAGMKEARVSVSMKAIADRISSSEWRAELDWNAQGNSNQIHSNTSEGDISVSTTQSFIVYF